MILEFTPKKGLSPLFEQYRDIVHKRVKTYLQNINEPLQKLEPELLKLISQNDLFKSQDLSPEENIIILTALVPHLVPNLFESIILQHFPNGGELPEWGGVKGQNHRGMLPTGETALFILCGMHLEERCRLNTLFSPSQPLFIKQILQLESVREGEPQLSGRLLLSTEWLEKYIYQREYTPVFGLEFPAKKIETRMEWEDAVLNPFTKNQVEDIALWMTFHQKINEDPNLGRKIKPGFRVLFHGPSGTGKTLTAALLGKQFKKEVYRIDLSQVVSKYIGETEKNLETVFKKAEKQNWILFFDEADALFGKRTNVQSSHDKYANQEVSYLLQRVEDYPGLLILASNFKNNLDEAFIRRFHSLVHFPMPNSVERLQIWQKSLPKNLNILDTISLPELAKKYEMTGAAILNAVQYAVLRAYGSGNTHLEQEDLLDGIRKEYLKEEKAI